MVAIAALLAALVYRSLLLPGGLALSRLHSTYSATVVSEVQHRIRTDHRLQMTQVQVRASNGIITLSGDVGSAAERVASMAASPGDATKSGILDPAPLRFVL